ncbi:MAG: hypothetical protein KC486_15630, partial [Myxococcales bacterium]|nr:hypothetical protein [Myxococcales bacterium]
MDGENSERSLDTMGASRRAPQLIAALACLVTVPAAAAAPTSPPTERVDASTEEEPRWVMTPASTELIRAAAAPHELLSSIAPGWVWRSLSVERSSARLVLTHDDPPAERATLTLQHPETATTEELLGRGPTLAVILEAADDDGRAAAAILGQALLAADRAGALAELWTERPTPVVAPIVAAEPPPPRPEIVAEEDEEPARTSDERR